jgi:hypothetical protein
LLTTVSSASRARRNVDFPDACKPHKMTSSTGQGWRNALALGSGFQRGSQGLRLPHAGDQSKASESAALGTVSGMAGSLASVELKLQRAGFHLAAVETLAALPQRVTTPRAVAVDSRTVEYHLRPPTFPADELSVVLGDFLFDLRSSLDHLAFQLHVRRHRGRVPAAVERASAFPIHVTEPKVPTAQWKEIKTLAARERARLWRLQPFLLDPRSPSFSPRDQSDDLHWKRTVLRDLSRLNNIDKHRRLSVVAVAMQGTVVEVGDFEEERRSGAPIDSSKWVVRRKYATPQANLPMHPGIVMDVGLESDGGYFPMVVPWMQLLRRVTGEIIDVFRPLF